jgi:exoribonuclease II
MNHQLHFDLSAAARRTMLAHGFEPDYPPAIAAQLEQLRAHPPQPDPKARDLRNLLWSSIDNDTSKDLDQIEYVEALPNGSYRVLIGIADVDAFVPKGSPIDQHALRETTTVYTGVDIFAMLPEELSTGSTSLLQDQERLAVVGDFTIDAQAHVAASDIYLARVLNKAQLAYPSIGAWLRGQPAPPKVVASPELQQQLHLQDQIAQGLLAERDKQGALNLETIETHPIHLSDGEIDIEADTKNRATQIIEDFMIAANGAVARMLDAKGYSSIRRVVRIPKRWDRIVELARQRGTQLPTDPDPKPLHNFLCDQQRKDPDHFADLSLAVIKLLGPGEYILEKPGQEPIGHFGLAVHDYTHSTAPNRRYADLVIQRIVKAMIARQPSPYSDDELSSIAAQCTRMEDAERKVSREMQKRIAAVAMSGRVGQTFDAIVTGVNEHGSFVRTLRPPVDGMLVQGVQGVDVGDRLRVSLVRTDPAQGYIDFARV